MSTIHDVIEDVMKKSKSPGELKSMLMMKPNGEFRSVDSYELILESPNMQLEPIYYWILDACNSSFKVEKIVDNFRSSPGSGHFAEMGQRTTKMQEEAMKILGGLNQVIKSSLNLVYDLREFKQRLQHYKDSESKDKLVREGANLALKQVWLDSVDVAKRGRGSIHQMAAELGYTTLREAFLVAETLEDLDKMKNEEDGVINDQVARVLKPRLKEFLDWKKYSYTELNRRYNIEKSYLKSQVETIKLYTEWIKPYLEAAKKLRQEGFEKDAALVNAFSTTMFDLTLLCRKKTKIPEGLKRYEKNCRDYFSVLVVDFVFRGHLLQRLDQRGNIGPVFGGLANVKFTTYGLNQDEIKLIEEKLDKSKIDDAFSFNSDIGSEALKELKEELDAILREDELKIEQEKEENKKKKEEDIDPISSLFNFKKKEDKKEDKKNKILEAEKIPKDNWAERQLRSDACNNVGKTAYNIYDIYKKGHKMASLSGLDKFTSSIVPNPETGLKEALKSGNK